MISIKHLILGILTMTCAVAAAQTREDTYHLFGYRLIWADEFDGQALDRDKWNVELRDDGCGNHELQRYVDTPENLRVADGKLIISAVRTDLDSIPFTSTRLNTLGKFEFTYGITEARIRLPKTADGLWPAFWMMGADVEELGWPACGETDILEMGHGNGISAGTQEQLFNGAVHWGPRWDIHCQVVGDRTNEYSLQDGEFHRYFLVWTPQSMTMYVDSDPVPYLTLDITSRNDERSPGCYLHKPNFILLNLAVGGDFPGIHQPGDITALRSGRASMEVDYVRVYQPIDNEDTASASE